MSFTFGRTTTTAYNGSAAADEKYAGRFLLSAAGVLQSISMYLSVDAGGGAPVRFAVYAVSGGDPGVLLAQTETVTIGAGTGAHWRTLSFTSPPTLAAGTYYYLAVHCSSSYLNIYRDDTGGLSNHSPDAYSDGFESSWGGSNPGTKYYCMYGTLNDPPPPDSNVAKDQQVVLYVEADPPTETTLDVLRIYKGNGSTYTEITSSTIQGFSDLRKTAVLNGPGSLEFTLAASTVKQLNTWIDENSVIEHWSGGERVGCYYVDEYTPSWATCSAVVRCLGALSLAGRVLWDSANVPVTIDDLAMAALVTEVDASNTGTVWRWDEEYVDLGSTGVAVAASGNSALDWLATIGPMISGRFWIDEDWYFHAAILKDPDEDEVDKTYAMGTNGRDFKTTYSARAIYNYLTVICPNAEAPGYVICADETSQATYGIRAAKVTYSDATSLAMGTAYGEAQLAVLAYPQLSVTVKGDHDAAVLPGMLAEVTGLEDGRTYKGIIQQVSWRVGDLTDEVILSAQPLNLNTAVSAGFSPTERLNLGAKNAMLMSHVYATRDSDLTISSGGTTFVWDDEVIDTHGAYDNSTGIFTAPVAGCYHFDARMSYNYQGWGVGTWARMWLYKNGSNFTAFGDFFHSGSITLWLIMHGSLTLTLAKNDTVRVVCIIDSGSRTSRTLDGQYIRIDQIA